MTVLNQPCAIGGPVLSITRPLRIPVDPEVRHSVRARLRCGERRIVLDLTRVSDIDAAGIGELVRAYNMARAVDGTMQVVNPPARVGHLLERVGLDALLVADPVTFSLAD